MSPLLTRYPTVGNAPDRSLKVELKIVWGAAKVNEAPELQKYRVRYTTLSSVTSYDHVAHAGPTLVTRRRRTQAANDAARRYEADLRRHGLACERDVSGM